MSNCDQGSLQPELFEATVIKTRTLLGVTARAGLQSNLPKQARKEAFDSTDKTKPEKFVMGLLLGGRYPNGINPIQLCDLTGWDITTSRPALSRLKRKGLLTISKRIKDTRCKIAVCVYVLTEEGRNYGNV